MVRDGHELNDRKPRWVHPGFLSACFVAFLALAAIAGSLGAGKHRSAGNPYWEQFLEPPLPNASDVSIIGVWRHDRLAWDQHGADHCGFIVRALGPREPSATAAAAAADRWGTARGPSGDIEEARLEDAFCGAPEMLSETYSDKIETAWREPMNPRFLEEYEDGRLLTAGVFDVEARRIYTWFSVRNAYSP